jgi:hypothetical protein
VRVLQSELSSVRVPQLELSSQRFSFRVFQSRFFQLEFFSQTPVRLFQSEFSSQDGLASKRWIVRIKCLENRIAFNSSVICVDVSLVDLLSMNLFGKAVRRR